MHPRSETKRPMLLLWATEVHFQGIRIKGLHVGAELTGSLVALVLLALASIAVVHVDHAETAAPMIDSKQMRCPTPVCNGRGPRCRSEPRR